MSFKHTEIVVPSENPFLNCKLGREKYAKVLTSIVESYQEGFVMAIDNKWGTGKTTFVRMWQQDLINSNFVTIYFNAWENDFEDSPMTAFLGELKILNTKSEPSFNKVLKNAALLSKNVAPALLKAVLSKYVDSETLTTAISDSSKSVLEIFEEDVKEYSKRKKSIFEFRNSLSEFVAQASNGKPLVFIIDELDRCRPNYSVLLLEQIKHFFSVPNVVFVLSIDKLQLECAICGVYGSERIDATEYLKRFIDIEYRIPEPQGGKFFDYLYNFYGFDGFFRAEKRIGMAEFQYERNHFIETGKTLIGALTLRQQEKILSHARLALRMLNFNNYLLPTVFTFLSFAKHVHSHFYDLLSNGKLSVVEIQEEFYTIVLPFVKEDNQRLFAQIEAYLLRFYENYKFQNVRSREIMKWDRTQNREVLMIQSKIDNDSFSNYLTSGELKGTLEDTSLSYLMNKLDLTEDIKIA